MPDDKDLPEVRTNRAVRDADPIPEPPPITDYESMRAAKAFHTQYNMLWQYEYGLKPQVAAAQAAKQKK